MKKYLKIVLAEFIGTLVLVTFACGVAAWTGAAVVPTALAFGLVIVAMAYSIGNVSGCQINPAVSIAMAISKKITWKEFGIYVIAQTLGAIAGAALLLLFLGPTNGFGANTIQATLLTSGADWVRYIVAIVAEVVLTFTFVIAILGVTSKKDNGAVAGLVIGGALVLVHLLGLGLTGTSVNPARSIGPALFAWLVGDNQNAITQLPIFIVGPLLGGALAALVYRFLDKKEEAAPVEEKAE